MSADKITEHYKEQEDSKLPCPACMEDGTDCTFKYTYDQLYDHLSGRKHTRGQLIEAVVTSAMIHRSQKDAEIICSR